jgi:hypothetical protein
MYNYVIDNILSNMSQEDLESKTETATKIPQAVIAAGLVKAR